MVQIVASELSEQNPGGEYEIDLDILSVPTLFKLETYVNQCLGLKASGASKASGVRRKKLHPEDFDGDTASNLSPKGGEDSSSSDSSEGELDVVF